MDGGGSPRIEHATGRALRHALAAPDAPTRLRLVEDVARAVLGAEYVDGGYGGRLGGSA